MVLCLPLGPEGIPVIRRPVFLLAGTLLAAIFVYAFFRTGPCKLYVPPSTRLDQGCINQGNDRRIAAPVVCWLQRHLSWKSAHEPHFYLLGNPQYRFLGLAWPPYLVYNSYDGAGHWRMFRLGFRYDRKWRGYIFPTLARKCLPSPLDY